METFVGDQAAIKYARRDVKTLLDATGLCAQRRSAVQAGGNLGVFAMELASRFGGVYCFEPHGRIFRDMVHNLRDVDNVFPMQAALGAEHGGIQVTRGRRRKTHLPPHDGVTHVSGTGPIPRLRVDDLALTDLDLLVLDLEGYELWALMGADETVARCRPVVMVEINENCEFEGIKQDDVRTWLRIRGYQLALREFSDEVWTWRK